MLGASGCFKITLILIFKAPCLKLEMIFSYYMIMTLIKDHLEDEMSAKHLARVSNGDLLLQFQLFSLDLLMLNDACDVRTGHEAVNSFSSALLRLCGSFLNDHLCITPSVS